MDVVSRKNSEKTNNYTSAAVNGNLNFNDKLFKSMMDVDEVAIEFFEKSLSERVLDKINLEIIDRNPREILTKELQSRIVDVLYCVPLKNTVDDKISQNNMRLKNRSKLMGKSVITSKNKTKRKRLNKHPNKYTANYGNKFNDDLKDLSSSENTKKSHAINKQKINRRMIYILVEHQSSSDSMLAFRMHEYWTNVVSQHKKNFPGLPLPWVEAVVCYAGKNKMSKKTYLSDLFGEMSEIAHDIYSSAVNVFDICRLSDAEISEMPYLGVMAYLFKYRFKESFEKLMTRVLLHLKKHSIIDDVGKLISDAAIYYLYGRLDGTSEDLYQLLQRLPNFNDDNLNEQCKEGFMTFRESFIAEGHATGHETGHATGHTTGHAEGAIYKSHDIAKKLISYGMSLEDVSEQTDVEMCLLNKWANKK